MPDTDLAASADRAAAGLVAAPAAGDACPAPRAAFAFECLGPDGAVKWRDGFSNVVTTSGKQNLLDVYLGATAKPSWFVILKGTGTPAAGDTLATHATWTEATPYTGNRPAITFGAATVVNTTGAQVVNGTAVSFAITATATVAGAGVCTAATGTTGTLYNVGDFAAARSVASGDTLAVTITLSMAA